MKSIAALVMVCTAAVTLSASSGRPIEVGARARGAQRIVVATVSDVQTRFDVNEHGDRLIVSQAWLDVSETLKGPFASTVAVDVEGGTIGDLTLDVSDMPAVKRGSKAVFFLDAARGGVHKPHGRGLGILMLDAAGRVQNSSMSLSDVRALVRSALR